MISDSQGHERVRIGEIVETAVPGGAKGGGGLTAPVITADWWGMRVKNAAGAAVIEIGRGPGGPAQTPVAKGTPAQAPYSTVATGGRGFNGHLLIRNGAGEAVVEAKVGPSHSNPPPPGGGFAPAVSPVDLEVGTLFYPGSVTVKALAKPTTRVRLASSPAMLEFADNDQPHTRLDGHNADLWLGGNGADSDIYLFDKRGDNATPAKATFHLRGSNPGIGMLVAGGKPTVRVDGPSADVWLGGNGADGAIVLFDKNGDNGTMAKASIVIDGGKGDIVLPNADCAEEFEVAGAADVEPGTVMVIDEDGRLRPSEGAYDRRVAGVISGAGELRPAITLGRTRSAAGTVPVALVGRVFCKADAGEASIEVGDLLTTSPRAGHAMKATDPVRAFGSVLGKALAPLRSATGLIPILVALQ